MPRCERTEGHKMLIGLATSTLIEEKVRAEAVKAVGALELQYAKLRLARFKARQAREKQKANDPGRYRL